jgi:hypothetical protein
LGAGGLRVFGYGRGAMREIMGCTWLFPVWWEEEG